MRAQYEVSGLAQCRGQEWPSPIVFQDLRFSWEAPTFHMILGSSGSGKSTLLKTLSGVWRPLMGEIRVGGVSLWQPGDLTPNPEGAKLIGYAFQNNALFSSMRVIDNLAYPLRIRNQSMSLAEAHAISMDWLQKVGLENSAWLFPGEISGGMQNRVAIARALVLAPDYLFLDDPTAGLDPVTSEKLMALILNLITQKSGLVVMVTNDRDRVRDTKAELHCLVDGKLLSRGDDLYDHSCERFLK